jgi:Flp pilus assembly pilin Flp
MRCGLNRFRADQRGVVAIEFALLAIPFFFLLFASIKTAIIMKLGWLSTTQWTMLPFPTAVLPLFRGQP